MFYLYLLDMTYIIANSSLAITVQPAAILFRFLQQKEMVL